MANTKKYSLSEYDEKLSEKAKQGIRSAKADYAKAQASGDTVGMARANAEANRIRKQYGGYVGGSDGSSYYPVNTLSSQKRPTYSSDYTDIRKNVQDDILSREEFSYDIDSDPMYMLYKKVYAKAGNDAYDRALASDALKTGGIVNTNAVTAATQAQNYYNTLLADKVTALYEKAYGRYLDSVDADYDKLNMLDEADYADYLRYRDSVDDFESDRSFNYNMYRDDYEDVMSQIRQAEDMAYKKSRDEQTDKYNSAKLASDMEKWQQQSETDRYATLAKLIQSVYNKSNVGVNIDAIMDLLGL